MTKLKYLEIEIYLGFGARDLMFDILPRQKLTSYISYFCKV